MLFVSPRAARFLLLEDPLPVISTAISTPTPSKAGGISSLPRSNYRTTSVPVPIIPSSALHVHERQFNSPPPFASDIPWSKEGDEKYTEAGSFLSIGNNDPPLPSPLFTSSGAPTTFLSLPSHLRVPISIRIPPPPSCGD